MAQLMAVASGVGRAIQAFKQRKLKIEESKAYREAKNRSMAATTREMAEEERNKEYMYSRALALAAASGGGVDDPGVVKVLADLNAEGEYRIMSRLWSGQNEAEGLIYRAEAAKREGDALFTAGMINAVTSVMSGGISGGGFGGLSTSAQMAKGAAAAKAAGPKLPSTRGYA